MRRALIISILMSLSFAPTSFAEDTDIFGVVRLNVKPNLVIILDNSLSMTQIEGPIGSYDKNYDYTGEDSIQPNAIGQYKSGKYYKAQQIGPITEKIKSLFDEMNKNEVPQELISELDNTGKANKGTAYYYTGNYLNWFYECRFNYSKRVIYRFLRKRMDIDYGLMVLSDKGDGGKTVSDISSCGNSQCTMVHLKNQGICKLPHSNIGESLVEAGYYYMGVNKSYLTNQNYQGKSPIRYWCQQNHALVISDGMHYFDRDWSLWWPWEAQNRITLDDDGVSGYLDDAAAYLYTHDLRPDIGTPDTLTEMQVMKTHTATFNVDTGGWATDLLAKLTTNQRLMKSAAARGGGTYSVLRSPSDIDPVINGIMNNILNLSSGFSSAYVPVSSSSDNYSSEYAYQAMFYPPTSDDGRWIGNIKKFAVGQDGAINRGQDLWTSNTDQSAMMGGVRQKLMERTTDRNIYTNINGTSNRVDFKIGSFDTSALTKYELTSDLIKNIRCGGECDGMSPGSYALGDIIHFTPLLHYYKNANGTVSGSRIFVGSNDGMIHCFDDASGDERWAYIPEQQLSRLKYLTPEGNNAGSVLTHSYFIDGGRTLYEEKQSDNSLKKLLIFGERRGGKNYYALDVTSPDSPQKAYTLNLTSDSSFGQSWSNPQVVPVVYGNNIKNVFWIGGGYDEENQENFGAHNNRTEPKPEDDVGKGIYAVDAGNGDKLNILGNTNLSAIQNCILDPVSFNPGFKEDDANPVSDIQKKAYSRLYACDMNGNLWGFRDDEIPDDSVSFRGPGVKDGAWIGRKIFSKGNGPQRKVFYRPEVVLESFSETKKDPNGKIIGFVNHLGEYVYFGTGDREDPTYMPATNDSNRERFYAVKNYWLKGNETSLVEANLADVTTDSIQMSDDTALKQTLMSFGNRGWYINLENPGEKVVSAPLAYRGMIFFTTFTPSEDQFSDGRRGQKHRYRNQNQGQNNGNGGSNNGGNGNGNANGIDPCPGDLGAIGTSRLYALNYKTGEAVLDLDTSSSVDKLRKDSDGNYLDANGSKTDRDHAQHITGLHKNDRVAVMGSGMPGEPHLIFPKDGGVKLIANYGTNNIWSRSLNVTDMNVFYWKEKK